MYSRTSIERFDSFSTFEDYLRQQDESLVPLWSPNLPDMPPDIWDATTQAVDFYMIADESGMRLNQDFRATLSDKIVMRRWGLSALSRISRLIGKGVNGECQPAELFAPRGYDASAADDWLPAQAQLLELENRLHSPYYRLLTRMLQDIVFPKQEAEGYLPVVARPPECARQVLNAERRQYDQTALCDYAEYDFVVLLSNVSRHTTELARVQQDDQLIGYQKLKGDQTMLLARPVLLNGVRIEPGAIMTMQYDKDGWPAFSFGRLSLFGCVRYIDVVRYFASNIKEEIASSAVVHGRMQRALQSFRSQAGVVFDSDESENVHIAPGDIGPERALQLSIQKRIFDMAAKLSCTPGETFQQKEDCQHMQSAIYELRQCAIRRYDWEAFENAFMSFLGQVAAKQKPVHAVTHLRDCL